MLGGYLSYLFDLSTLEGGRGGSFEKLQKFSGHRVDQNTVTVKEPTVTSQTHGDARGSSSTKPLSSGWVQFIAGSMHTDALVHTEPAAHRLSIAFPFHRHHITLYTLHRTMHSQSSNKVLRRAPSTRMFIPHKVQGRAPSTRMFMPPKRRANLTKRRREM